METRTKETEKTGAEKYRKKVRRFSFSSVSLAYASAGKSSLRAPFHGSRGCRQSLREGEAAATGFLARSLRSQRTEQSRFILRDASPRVQVWLIHASFTMREYSAESQRAAPSLVWAGASSTRAHSAICLTLNSLNDRPLPCATLPSSPPPPLPRSPHKLHATSRC
jgi:hypothetical protein